MSDLHTRFKSLDDVATPNLWHEIEKRAMAKQPAPRSLRWVLIAVILLLVLAIGGAALIGSGIVKLPVSVETSPTPSSAPESAIPSSTPVEVRAAAWTATGSMLEARTYHTATRLLDGTVLVAGGFNGSDLLASAELYDPVNGSWTATGNMIEARAYHTATLLRDGRVLVAGSSRTIVQHAELYDPRSGTWTATASPSIFGTNSFADRTATRLADGRVLVAGGGSAELYDPVSGTWSPTGDMVEQRYDHTATLLPNGTVLVVGGGCCVQGRSLATAELYDPDSGTWAATGSMSYARAYPMTTLLPDGTVLVVGGGTLSEIGLDPLASAELYDPVSGTWTATGTMDMARARLGTSTLLLDGTVLAVGGVLLPSAELYDPSAGSWTATARMGEAHLAATATLLFDGTVLLVGGFNSSDTNGTEIPLASAELYDPGSP